MIIPIPVDHHPVQGHFTWQHNTPAHISTTCDVCDSVAHQLRNALAQHCRLEATVERRAASAPQATQAAATSAPASIQLCLQPHVPELDGVPLRAEGYLLSVTTQGIVVCAEGAAGLFYGTQTLLQMVPWTEVRIFSLQTDYFTPTMFLGASAIT